ncbi:hypothetical protein GCM10009193_30630 [Shewanella aestuarii]|nr:hypothetical protein GCM10009193_30630 [Shewanella aestuarii]
MRYFTFISLNNSTLEVTSVSNRKYPTVILGRAILMPTFFIGINLRGIAKALKHRDNLSKTNLTVGHKYTFE